MIYVAPPNPAGGPPIESRFILDFSWRWRRLTRHRSLQDRGSSTAFRVGGPTVGCVRMRVKAMTMPGKIADKGTRNRGVGMQLRTENASIAIDARIDLCRAEHS